MPDSEKPTEASVRIPLKGDVLTDGDGASYVLLEPLGEGATAYVFKAQNRTTQELAALKILRVGLSQKMIENFWREAQVLGQELGNAEIQAGDGLRNVLRWLSSQHKGKFKFLALELVKGESLEKRLQVEPWLPEPFALQIADRVLRVLDLLHTRVRRTYTDLQLRNIRLLADDTADLIRVIDWNHVSDKLPEDQEPTRAWANDDLMRFGAYLYRMLTGEGALETGEPEEALMAHAGKPRWDGISLGTRRILARALSPQTAKRFESAAAFRTAVQAQAHAWDIEWVDHLGDARELLTHESFDDDAKNRVEIALDMAKRLGGDPKKVEIYQRQLRERRHLVSEEWKKGEGYMAAEMYGEAADLWLPIAEEKRELTLWREVLRAQAGRELGAVQNSATKQILEQVQAAVAQMYQDPQAALEMLQELAKTESASIKLLRDEVDARRLIIHARKKQASALVEDWNDAQGAYTTVIDLIGELPYRALLLEKEGWQEPELERAALEKRIERRTTLSKRLDEIGKKLESIKEEEFRSGIAKLEAELEADKSNPEWIPFIQIRGQALLDNNRPRQALEVLAVGRSLASKTDTAEKYLETYARAAAQVESLGTVEEERIKKAREAEQARREAEQARLETERRQAELQAERAQSGHLAAERAKDERRKQEQHAMELKALEQEKVREQERLAAQARQQEELRQAELRAQHAELERARQHRAELERLAQEKWNQQRQYLIPQAQTALANGDYLGVRELVTQAPQEDFYANKGWHPLFFELQRHFDEVARRQVVPQLHLLLQILNYMEPNASRVEVRQKRYDEVVNKIDADTDKWANATLRWLDEQSQKKKPEEYGALIAEVDRVLPLVSNSRMQEHYKVFRGMLERKMSAQAQTATPPPSQPKGGGLLKSINEEHEKNRQLQAEKTELEKQIANLKQELGIAHIELGKAVAARDQLQSQPYLASAREAEEANCLKEENDTLRNKIKELEARVQVAPTETKEATPQDSQVVTEAKIRLEDLPPKIKEPDEMLVPFEKQLAKADATPVQDADMQTELTGDLQKGNELNANPVDKDPAPAAQLDDTQTQLNTLQGEQTKWVSEISALQVDIAAKAPERASLNATDQQVSQDLELKDQRIKALELDLELKDKQIEVLALDLEALKARTGTMSMFRAAESEPVVIPWTGAGFSKTPYPLSQGNLESLIASTFPMLSMLNADNVAQFESKLREILEKQESLFTPDIRAAVTGGIALAQLLKMDFRGAEIYDILKQSQDEWLKNNLQHARSYFEEKALIYWQGDAAEKYRAAKREMEKPSPNSERAFKNYTSAYITSFALELVFYSDWARYFKNNKLVSRPDLRQSGVLAVSREEIKKIRQK